jgi:thiol:disulfide interchange protein DsbD
MILRRLFLLLMLCAGFAYAADPDLLDPEKAFEFSARVAGPDVIEVRYVIAKGYYLYRDKLRFTLEPATLARGDAQLPPGLVHKDEFFGETRIYRDIAGLCRCRRLLCAGRTESRIATGRRRCR